MPMCYRMLHSFREIHKMHERPGCPVLAPATKADMVRLEGEIKRLELLMKVAIGLANIGMACFSPNAAELNQALRTAGRSQSMERRQSAIVLS